MIVSGRPAHFHVSHLPSLPLEPLEKTAAVADHPSSVLRPLPSVRRPFTQRSVALLR